MLSVASDPSVGALITYSPVGGAVVVVVGTVVVVVDDVVVVVVVVVVVGFGLGPWPLPGSAPSDLIPTAAAPSPTASPVSRYLREIVCVSRSVLIGTPL